MSLLTTLKQRAPLAILAMVLGPLIILYTPSWCVLALSGAALVVLWREWEKMLFLRHKFFYRLVIIGIMGSALIIEKETITFLILGGFAYCLEATFFILRNKNVNVILTKIYGVSSTLLIWLSLLILTPSPVKLLFALIWIIGMDGAGLIVGKLVGKIPLAVQISPQKTIEGALAGLAFSLLMINIGKFYDLFLFGYDQYFIGILVWVMAVAGDLVESQVKRIACIKDSGNCLPGHGGMADRLDSMAMALPVIALMMV